MADPRLLAYMRRLIDKLGDSADPADWPPLATGPTPAANDSLRVSAALATLDTLDTGKERARVEDQLDSAQSTSSSMTARSGTGDERQGVARTYDFNVQSVQGGQCRGNPEEIIGHQQNAGGQWWPKTCGEPSDAIDSVSAWRSWQRSLDPARPPGDVPPGVWAEFIEASRQFLERWAEQAAAGGWRMADLFCADRHRPYARVDLAGLVWFIGSGEVVELTTDRAVIRKSSGARQTFYRRLDGK
jgi:hypothetical protein